MKIVLNGNESDIKASNIEDLLEELDITSGKVAVEVNLKVIRKCDYPSSSLKDGDTVEIVNFVGGG